MTRVFRHGGALLVSATGLWGVLGCDDPGGTDAAVRTGAAAGMLDGEACGTVGGAVLTEAERTAVSRGGVYEVTWRALDDVELGAPFAVEVEARRRDGAGLAGDAAVHVDARMPAHNHGMNVEPVVRGVGPGVWRARGMTLHMTGAWELTVDVREGGVWERAAFGLVLE